MYDRLFQSITNKVSITKEEFEFCKTLFLPKRLRKRQYLLQEGDICKYTAFVEKGILRSYKVDAKGNDHILQFAFEGWWMADLYSFMTKEPSSFNIDAIEDCELLLINDTSWDKMLDEVPALERYFRLLIQNNLITTQRRLLGAFSETAEEKYLKLLDTFPGCFQRIPQHMLASYLGITRETLSRIRNQIATRKTNM